MSTVRLILEHSPLPQAMTEITFHGGQLVVGRGDDAAWCIDDPEQYVSRKHFVISEENGKPIVTDASTGGLYVDGASASLGAGNSVALEDGMRLRFGDFVARVEMGQERVTGQTTPRAPAASPYKFEFDPPPPPEPEPARPADLPKPFGQSTSPFATDRSEPRGTKPLPPLDREDPFALDSTVHRREPKPRRTSGYFAEDDAPAPTPDTKADEEAQKQEPAPFSEFELKPSGFATGPKPRTPSTPVERSTDGLSAREAFYKGLGLDAGRFPVEDPEAEMEALGRRFRALVEGLTHLLRNRAEEKQRVRVAQTIIGSANVNPLSFAVGIDDAVSSVVARKSEGYLDPDEAIADSFRSLSDHQMRTWTALQSALRKMIDKFDPEEIEREIEDTGRLEALIAGGRKAKLWQVYEDRFREIARAAEEKFLGEVGADFRNAYEDKGRK